jgi:hypothetical protein
MLIYAKLVRAVEQPLREATVDRLIQLTHSLAWYVNQLTGFMAHILFVGAFIFLVMQTDCYHQATFLYSVCALDVFLFVAHVVYSYKWFSNILGAHGGELWELAEVRGATSAHLLRYTRLLTFKLNGQHEYLDAHHQVSNQKPSLGDVMAASEPKDSETVPGSVVCASNEHDDSTETCSICFNNLQEGDFLRQLQCHHYFHKACIDVWLHEKKICPMCMLPIDQPVSSACSSVPSECNTETAHSKIE